MNLRFLFSRALIALCFIPAARAVGPVTAIRDVFGRDVTTKGITLVDWEGFMANPATKYHFDVDATASFPLRVTIRSNGHRIDFDDLNGQTGFRATGLDSVTGNVFKVQIISTATGGDFYVSTYPDRDGANESYTLTFQVIDARNAVTNFTVPLTVIDQDKPDGPQGAANLLLDYSRDTTGFFANADVRRLTDQAAADYSYFLDAQNFATVAAGAETTRIFTHNGFAETLSITNATAYNGFKLYVEGIDAEPEKRSTGLGSPIGGFQSVNGVATALRRSAVEAIYTKGNFNDNGWYYSPLPATEDDWTHTYYSNDIPDYYSVAQHEMGHAIAFAFSFPNYFSGRSGFSSAPLLAYMGRVIAVDATDHLAHVTDPASGIGAFGSEYEAGTSIMRPGRFMITKANLLVLEAVGWKLRPTSAFVPVAQGTPDFVEARAGAALTTQLNAAYGIPPYSWKISSGALPAGLAIDSYGLITGTPSIAGTSTAQLTVTDYNGVTDTRSVPFLVGPANASASNPGRLTNLSILAGIATSGEAFTLGYVVGGTGTSGSKPLVIRAAGPALAALGVGGTLADPKMELFAGAIKTDENDNWGGGSDISAGMAGVGAFAYASPTSKDAASLASITSRDNSVKISAADSGTGAVIAEVYDATPAGAYTLATPRLINCSVLKQVGNGFTVGFVIGGSTSRTVVVRAVGPGLAAVGVTAGFVPDPRLALFVGSLPISTNDTWGGTAALSSAFTQVGAFQIPAMSLDAALLATLPPGQYSAQVSAPAGTNGLVLVEVYEVP